jgi:hypothetical protein
MAKLLITELMLQSQSEFQFPVPFSEALLTEIAKDVCRSSAGPFLNLQDVSVSSDDALFGYDFSIPMFNGSAELFIDAHNVRVTFKQVRNSEQVKALVEHLLSLLSVAVRQPVTKNVVTVWATGIAEPIGAYGDYMKQFTSLGQGIVSGGRILISGMPEWTGEFRFATEKWFAHEHGLFLSSQATTEGKISVEFLQAVGRKFSEMAACESWEVVVP